METHGKDTILPKTLPVMVFEGACLFPQTMLPLFIFEPRYRELLTFALETDRLIVLSRPEGLDDVAAMGCVGLIRTCVSHPDGTSHLFLQGLCRVKFTEWLQIKPFRKATVEVFKNSNPENPSQKQERLLQLRGVLRSLIFEFDPEIAERIYEIEDPDVLTDMVAAATLPAPEQRLVILEEEDPRLRQTKLVRMLLERE